MNNNISSTVISSQLTAASEQGGSYGLAVAMKIKDQIKQQGDAAVQLIESAPAPITDDTRGKNLATYA